VFHLLLANIATPRFAFGCCPRGGARIRNETTEAAFRLKGHMEADMTRAKGKEKNKDKHRSHQDKAPNPGQKDAQQETKSQSELANMERGRSHDRNQGDD
jgi:hypothetical protein